MNSVQESKNELEASIRYAENAISSAKQTIESMEFRQQMAQKNYQEQTGREAALEQEVAELREKVEQLKSDRSGMQDCIKLRENQVDELKSEGALLTERIDEMKDTAFADGNTIKHLKSELDKLRKEKEASSGPCGCQAYRDLEEARGRAEGEVELLQGAVKELESKVQGQYDDIVMLERDLTAKTAQAEAWKKEARGTKATMPVIPKDVAIAIFREGVAHGVSSACDEIDNDAGITIEETGYTGDFEVSFNRWIDLSEHLDLDWMRDKVGDYDEASIVEALKGLCADKEFECRIHGVDDVEAKDSTSS